MSEKRIVVRMEGEPSPAGDDVRLEDFVAFLAQFRDVLKHTERQFFEDEAPHTYTIADLSHSSPATVTIAEHGARTRGAVQIAAEAFRSIAAGTVPDGFDTPLLLEYRDLAKGMGRLASVGLSVDGATISVTRKLREQVDVLLGPDHREYGDVSGMLDVVNVHGRRHSFTIFPIAGARRVKCYFDAGPEGMAVRDRVGDAIKRDARYVTVSGTLRFKAGNYQPYAIDVVSVRVHPPEHEIPSLFDLKGRAPGGAQDERAEDFVRRLRDGWR
jgi:hypothetical protein